MGSHSVPRPPTQSMACAGAVSGWTNVDCRPFVVPAFLSSRHSSLVVVSSGKQFE